MISQIFSEPIFRDAKRLERVQSLFPELDRMFKAFAEENRFPGYAYGIMLDGKLVYSGGGGFADLEKRVQAGPKTLFRIASMTKSFIAMSILKLRDDGKLRLDDPACLYIPEMVDLHFIEDAPTITIRHLLTHTAGFSTDDPWADRKMEESESDLMALIRSRVYFSNPSGETYEYSNLGYAILGAIVQKVSKIPYDQYVNTRLGEVVWNYSDVSEGRLAHGYRLEGSSYKEEPLLKHGAFAALGGIFSSVESFSKYAALHQNAYPPRHNEERGPVDRNTIREMHRPHIFAKLEASAEKAASHAYGYGIQVIKDSLGRTIVGHNGGLPGFGSNWYILPEYGLGCIFFANLTYAPAYKISLQVLEKLINEAQLEPFSLPPSSILATRFDELVQFLPHWKEADLSPAFAPNFFKDISLEARRRESEALFAKIGNARTGELKAENQLRGSFILEGEWGRLKAAFSLTPTGRIQQLLLKEVSI